MSKTPSISDKVFNFPNPKFIEFMKRMWSSEPVSQTEKDTWNAAGGGGGGEPLSPHTPLIVVDHVAFVSLNALTDYQTHSILLPDKGDGLAISLSGSSSSSSLYFRNSDGFNIAGYIAHQTNTIHFDLDLSFHSGARVRANLGYKNTAIADPVYLACDESIESARYFELFNNISFTDSAGNRFIKIGVDIDVNANTIKLVVKYYSLINETDVEFLNRFDIKSY